MQKRNLSHADAAVFCGQMAMILQSGISATEGIALLAEDDTDDKATMQAIYDSMLEIGSLSRSLPAHFPAYLRHMVELGETTGRLDEVMAALSTYYEKEAALQQTIKSAITYPCIMVCMMLAVIVLLVTQVMPIFDRVFHQLGTEMTGFSRAILIVGEFLSGHVGILIGVLLLLVLAAVCLVKTRRGQKLLVRLATALHKTLADQIGAYRFASGMSLTLRSGLSPERCMELSIPLSGVGAFREKVAQCSEAVSQGADLCESLLSCGVFTGIYTKMAAIAARTGRMDEVMQKIADHCETEIDDKIDRLLSAVEPTLVIILSVLVGVILLSVMLPLINMMSAL